jgi:hypothetical protein
MGRVKSATTTATSRTAATARRRAEDHESAMDASSLLRQGLSLPQSSPPSPPSAQPPALPRARSPTAAPARFAAPRIHTTTPPVRPHAPLSVTASTIARRGSSSRSRARERERCGRWIWILDPGERVEASRCVWVRCLVAPSPVGGAREKTKRLAFQLHQPSVPGGERAQHRHKCDASDLVGSGCGRWNCGRLVWAPYRTR